MRVRFTTSIGMPVTDDQTEGDIGMISGIVLHPDDLKVEGFFVSIPAFLHSVTLFLPANDIQHFGTKVRVRHADVLSPVNELVRLQSLLEDRRPVIGQMMILESGRRLGRCADVQFETQTFQVEWLFPKQWFRWQQPVPRSGVLQVRPDAVLIRDLRIKEPVVPAEPVFKALDPLGGTPASRVIES